MGQGPGPGGPWTVRVDEVPGAAAPTSGMGWPRSPGEGLLVAPACQGRWEGVGW